MAQNMFNDVTHVTSYILNTTIIANNATIENKQINTKMDVFDKENAESLNITYNLK